MKLVEILAREWNEWPCNHDAPLAQNAYGGIYIPAEFRSNGCDAGLCMRTDQSDDWCEARVTRAQWEAERDRIAMECTSVSSNQEQISRQYEQELWDKVAVAYIGGCAADSSASWTNNATQDHVSTAADVADAFMAERAKRMKQGE